MEEGLIVYNLSHRARGTDNERKREGGRERRQPLLRLPVSVDLGEAAARIEVLRDARERGDTVAGKGKNENGRREMR